MPKKIDNAIRYAARQKESAGILINERNREFNREYEEQKKADLIQKFKNSLSAK